MNGNVIFYNNDNKLQLEYNSKIEKWMLWLKPDINSDLKIGSMSKGKGRFSKFLFYRLVFFSKYHNPPKNFKFYEYPNPSDENMDINPEDTKLKRNMLKFSAPKGMEIEGIRCDNLLDKNASINKYNTLNKRYNAKDINKYGNRFKNTLFNFMSKIDLSKDQDKIEVYDYLDTNNNKNTRLVYNIK